MRAVLVLAVAAIVPACGGGGGGGGGGVGGAVSNNSGGTATGSAVANTAFGGSSLSSNVIASNGDLRVGVNSAPAGATLPTAPTTGTVVAALTIDQTVISGNALITGTIIGS